LNLLGQREKLGGGTEYLPKKIEGRGSSFRGGHGTTGAPILGEEYRGDS